jgi:hypothetical protein
MQFIRDAFIRWFESMEQIKQLTGNKGSFIDKLDENEVLTTVLQNQKALPILH